MRHQFVTLTLNGNLEHHGFRVMVEMGIEGQRPDAVVTGQLPANSILRNALREWQQQYRQLDTPTRIRPKEIVYVGSMQRVAACRQAAKTLAQQFNQWLAAEGLRSIDQRLREELNTQDIVRVLVRTTNRDLYHLPWHLWDFLQRYPQAEVTLGSPQFKRPEIAPPTTKQVNILAILGHSDGIDISRDRALLSQLPNANVTFLVEPQRQAINDQFWERSWDILFFAGHSDSADMTGRIFLNPQESLTLEELSYGLRRAIANGLQLAIFNSCDGLGLAQALESLNLPQMIVMRQPVPDRIAQLFLTYLLPTYAMGQPLPLALRQARERLQGIENEFPCASWLPVLMQTVPDAPPTWQQLQQAEPESRSPQSQIAIAEISSNPGRWQPALLATLITAVLVLVVRSLGGLQPWELRAYDRLLQQRLPQSTPERLLVIEATEADVNRYGYPLPDQVLADVIERLRPYEPRLIGLDIFRDRPEANSPLQALFETQENLVGLCNAQIGIQGDQSGIAPPPNLSEDRLGFSNVAEDHDGVIRRHLVFMTPEADDPCATRFSLSALLAMEYLEMADVEQQILPDERLQLGQAIFAPLHSHSGPYHNLDHWGFQVLLNYADTETFVQQISVTDLLTQDLDFESLENYVVLIGMSAPVSNPTDYFLTPEGANRWPREQIAGVLLHAQMVNHLLTAALDGRSPIQIWPQWAEMIWIAGGCGLGGLVGWRYRRLRVAAIVAGGTVLLIYGIAWGLLNLGWWIPWVPAAIGSPLATAGVFASAYGLEQARRSRK
ncbi:CHASE2 domain-containing protein [Oscillatoria sp. CS-180]|uniref:CHASE2 domain-containing protein n=1 Tax=Oscillatoria sp. CS-180 TaxID=3021720 RepID=UPI00232DC6A2|nr:CHASE2 domain-containing protein [Oscillatoria sp. CS-180]MDB9524541.1 CHASE2 domain-containing protein [Oscillatoria sp. CS-180]